MKKLLTKLPGKKKHESPSRITNDTVAEHRERILAGGRRFKYPVQYSRHKLVINAVVISLVTLLVLLLVGWWQLYLAQNSSSFMYRVTRIVPLPVATVDGEAARYSDYLLNYRTSEYYLSKFDEIRPNSEDGKLQLQYKKREALDIAIADAYARKVAREKNVSISSDDVESVLAGLRQAANGELTRETSAASSQRVLGLSEDDLRVLVQNSILRSRAAFAVDTDAKALAVRAEALFKDNQGDIEKTAETLLAEKPNSVTVGSSGMISRASTLEGIRVSEVAKLEPGVLSAPIQSLTDDGYFFVKVLEKNDAQVSFAFLQIPLHTFRTNLETLKKDNKVHEYISIQIDQKTANPTQ